VLAQPISSLVFHHAYLAGHGLAGFVTDILSGVIGLVAVALIAFLVGAIWKRARRRFGGSSGQAADV
jgi:membrane protein DedA with SNARE-associated domain